MTSGSGVVLGSATVGLISFTSGKSSSISDVESGTESTV